MASKKFISAYGEKRKCSITFAEGSSLTIQSQKKECDINLLVSKYKQGGIISHVNNMQAQYGDLTGYDFHEYQNKIASAISSFEALPSRVRNRFQNDPALFLDFMNNPENLHEMVELGLAEIKEPETPEPPKGHRIKAPSKPVEETEQPPEAEGGEAD